MRSLLLFLLLSAFSVFAAEQTLFQGSIYHHGGYGGPTLKFTEIGPNNDFGLLMGGQGGWIVNHQFILGGGGWGLANNVDVDWAVTPYPSRMEFGYGGIYLGYVRNSDAAVHSLLDVIIGWGGAGIAEDRGDLWDDDYDEMWHDEDAFFIVEPGLSLEFNFTTWMRVAAGVSYRYVQGVDLYGMTDENLSGLSGMLQFKFGSF